MDSRAVHAILLAAGASARMGREKLLMEIGGRTVVEITLGNHLGSSLAGVCAVVPGWIEGFSRIMARNAGPRVTFVEVGEPCEMSTSLKTGWRWVSDNTDAGGVMISLADQPLVGSRTIDRLIEAYLASGRPLCVPVNEGRRGHPVIISPELDSDIMKLEGDLGARGILADRPGLVHEVQVETDEILLDLDRVEDMKTIRSRLDYHE